MIAHRHARDAPVLAVDGQRPQRRYAVALIVFTFTLYLMLDADVIPMWRLLAAGLAMLVPWGLALLLVADHKPERRIRALSAVTAAFALTLLAYYAVGFALHFGGIGLRYEHPDLDALVWEWSALNENWGATWGMAGLAGFGLTGARTPVALLLLLSALPAAITATIITVLSVHDRAPLALAFLIGGLTAGVGYPLLGNWTEGGGWLANLGVNIGAGQGFLDFGHSALFLLGGGVAFATMLAFAFHEPGAEPARDDPSPAMALAGMGLLLAGSVGWLLNQPLVDFEAFSPTLVLVNLWLAAAAGSLPYLLLALAGGRIPRPLLAVRGLAAGWVAGWAAAPFAAPGELLLVGLGAGLLSVLASAALQLLSRQHDAGETVAMLGLPAFWGLLAAGIFAPTPGQLQAQLIGAVILFLLAFSVGSVFIVPLVVLTTRTAPEPRRQTEATGAAQREGSVAVEERP